MGTLEELDQSGKQLRRSAAVASAIRQRIIAGEFAPGSQLPTWDDLEQQYSVGRNTLVRAIGQLKQQQFIYSSSTRGTYVVERPPHLHNYALLFHAKPGLTRWNAFWSALTSRAAEIEMQQSRRIAVKYGVRDEHNNAPLRQLIEEVNADQYAGLVYTECPDHISPQVLQQPDLPQVVIMAKSDRVDLPRVDIDRESFVVKAIEWLRARNRKRVAVLCAHPAAMNELLFHGIREAGFELRPEWFLSSSVDYPATAEPIIRLLLSQAQPESPDALIITNDNLVDSALAAVVAKGKRVPEDLEILAHSNWPTSKGHVVPTQRLGYDVRALLQACLNIIDQWRAGEEYPRVVKIPALFEHEVENAKLPG